MILFILICDFIPLTRQFICFFAILPLAIDTSYISGIYHMKPMKMHTFRYNYHEQHV